MEPSIQVVELLRWWSVQQLRPPRWSALVPVAGPHRQQGKRKVDANRENVLDGERSRASNPQLSLRNPDVNAMAYKLRGENV